MNFESRRGFASSSDTLSSDTLPIEIAFLRDWLSDRACLHEAAVRARRQRTCAARVLIHEGFVSETLFYRALARRLGVRYVGSWPTVDATIDLVDAITQGRVKLGADNDIGWLFAPSGDALRRLLSAEAAGHSLPEIGLTTPSHFRAILQRRCDRTIAYWASEALPGIAPALSARRMADWRARLASVSVPVAAIVGLAVTPRLVTDGFGVLFFAGMVVRLVVCAAGLDQTRTMPALLADADLPPYSILVALRNETDVVKDLMAALDGLDYPRAKLEALILVEPEDRLTRDTLAAIRLPPWCHVIVGPADDATLRTKPRALNIGLLFARGTLCTVYDAEDRPDPDQLRRAAAEFGSASAALACLQARLVIDNGRSNWLSCLFAIEYSALFDLFNIGTAAFRLPLALGGTSNHFRMSALRAVGGWDAWNVTEDAELGLRLARFGYQVGTMDSTTREDAPERIGAWLRQRRRWTKGWMQTLFVLVRDTPGAWRQYGVVNSLFVGLLLTNLVIGPPLLPFFGGCLIYHAVQDLSDAGGLARITEATLAVSVVSLGIGSTLWAGYAGMRIRRLGAFMPTLPLLLPYQLMISLAGWGGIYDLLVKPFHWHKTEHGQAARRKV